MDILNRLFEMNDKLFLEKLSDSVYKIETDDEEDEIEYVIDCRKNFVSKLNKINNRQFRLNDKRYYIDKLI